MGLWHVTSEEFLAALTRHAIKCIRHCELLVFHSPLRVEGVWKLALSGTCSPLDSPFTRHCEFTCLLLAFACWVQVISCTLCLLLASDSPLILFYSPWRVSFCTYLFFSSLLSVLSSIPAQLGKVRQIKRNRVFITYLSAFPSITCKTRNKCALIIQSKYYFLALINTSSREKNSLLVDFLPPQ